MEKIVFQNKKYGNTVFEEDEGIVSLRYLFGMPMDQSAKGAPERILGITDYDFGAGAELQYDLKLKECRYTEDELHLVYTASGTGAEIHTDWKYDIDTGIFTRKDMVINKGEECVTVYRLLPKFIFSAGEYECYVQNNTWCYENKGGWERLGRLGVSIKSEGGRTTQGAAPFLGIRSLRYDRGVAFHVVPKGNWEIRMERASAGVGPQGSEISVLRLGQSTERFCCELDTGECLNMPEIIIQGLPEGKLYRESENFQKWLLKHDENVCRVGHKVVYNPWYSCYDHINESELLAEAKLAKELGCEVFEVDAGWYGQGADWGCCVGDWREKQDGAFYGNLKAFADKIRALGLGFGLWMEPERIAQQTPKFKEHPEWFARGSGDCFYPKLWEKEPYEYIKGEILRLIETYGLVWMKLDFNFELEHDETRTQFLRYYESYYRLIDEVKLLHPDVFMEACAAGGLRTDINTMRHFDGHFICDNVNPFDGTSMYEQLLMRVPPNQVYCWMALQKGADIPAYFRDVSDTEGSIVVPAAPGAGFADQERIELDFLCKLLFKGMVGISGNIMTLDAEDRRLLKAYIAFYKEYREQLMDSTVTLDSEPTNIGERDHWRVTDHYCEKMDAHLIYVYRFGDIRQSHVIQIAHLTEKKLYRVLRKDSTQVWLGSDLKNAGIEVRLGRNSGEIICIRPEEEE